MEVLTLDRGLEGALVEEEHLKEVGIPFLDKVALVLEDSNEEVAVQMGKLQGLEELASVVDVQEEVFFIVSLSKELLTKDAFDLKEDLMLEFVEEQSMLEVESGLVVGKSEVIAYNKDRKVAVHKVQEAFQEAASCNLEAEDTNSTDCNSPMEEVPSEDRHSMVEVINTVAIAAHNHAANDLHDHDVHHHYLRHLLFFELH